MRMPAFKLIADGGADIIEIKTAFFLRHLGIKHNLKQQVAKLSAQVVEVFTRNRIQYFIGFFESVRAIVANVCSLSHGQPFSGSRKRCIIPSSRSIWFM